MLDFKKSWSGECKLRPQTLDCVIGTSCSKANGIHGQDSGKGCGVTAVGSY
jgi:hypothetical protein